MGRIEKTVFISYRRTNLPWALSIYQDLTHHGYDVFFDYLSIDSGSFETAILDNIRARAHFVLILTPSALERCKNPNDWLRREIETAIDEKRNIVPLMLEGFDFGSPFVQEVLTGKLSTISSINALPIHNAYVFEGMERLRTRFLNVALDDINLPALPEEAEKVAETQQTAANEAEPVSEEQLSAQTWFERGYKFAIESKNYEEALRCFSEAAKLAPNSSNTQYNIGIVFGNLNRLVDAENAYRKAIDLNPSHAEAYINLGILLSDNNVKRYDEAEFAFRKAVELEPSNYYFKKALDHFLELLVIDEKYKDIRKETDIKIDTLIKESETVFQKAIESNPFDISAYKEFVFVLRLCKKLEASFPLLEKMLEISPQDFETYLALASISKQLGKEILKEYIEKARQFISDDDWHNHACLESVCDNFDRAFEYLEKAAKLEKFNPDWAWQDPDLQWIRNDPRFVKIVGENPKK